MTVAELVASHLTAFSLGMLTMWVVVRKAARKAK